MKKTLIAATLLFFSLAKTVKSDAQVSLQVNIGGVFSAAINSNPYPVENTAVYNAAPAYYYYDDINCYYDVNAAVYIYPYNNVWYSSAEIPPMYRNYDFGHARFSRMDQREFQRRDISFRGPQNNGQDMQPNAMDNRNREMSYGRNNPMMNGNGQRGQFDNRNNQGNNNRYNEPNRQGNNMQMVRNGRNSSHRNNERF